MFQKISAAMKKKKYLIFGLGAVLVMASGFKPYDSKEELSDYYLSQTSAAFLDGGQMLVKGQKSDFETNSSKATEEYCFTEKVSGHTVTVYDPKDNAILYTVQGVDGYHTQIVKYDVESQKTEQFVDYAWGIHRIIPRENDYVIVGISLESNALSLYSIDRETKEITGVPMPDDKHDDLSVWQASYIPQTGDIVIQAYSESEQNKLTDEWNNLSEEEKQKDLVIPFYHYIYRDNRVEYLFEKDMPQSNGLISNGKEVLVGVQSYEQGESVLRYDMRQSELKEVEHIKNLDGAFYLDNAGRYVYTNEEYVVRKDVDTGEEETLDYDVDYIDGNGGFLLKK